MSEILKYNLFTEKFQYKDISNNDLDTFKDDELNRMMDREILIVILIKKYMK
jgi:hypothetical protein